MQFLSLCTILLCVLLNPWQGHAVTLQQMSVEEKVGQLLMAHFIGDEANADAQKLIQKAYVGGIIYYAWANTLSDPIQVQSLSNSLQRYAQKNPHPIPLFIAIDQEGGAVNRLKRGFTTFPSNYALGLVGQMDLVENTANAIGEELHVVGININLAPVVDVNTNPKNPIIGIRAFGDTPATVIQCGKAALAGYKKSGVIAALKHFPGHGDVTQDSHLALPVVNKDLATLTQTDIAPFAQLVDSADLMMTAHLLVPALDDKWCATLSKAILHDLLREQLGFQGVIMTDSLVMEAIGKQIPSIEEASLQAFLAGNDILLLGGHKLLDNGQYEKPSQAVERVLNVHRHLVQAVRSGEISEDRLNASVERILALKESHKITDGQPPNQKDILQNMHLQAHQVLAQQIAQKSVKCMKCEQPLPIDLKSHKVGIIAPATFQYELGETGFKNVSEKTMTFFFSGDDDIQLALSVAKEADLLIACSYNAWKTPKQLALLQALSQMGKPVVLFVLGDPQDSTLLKQNIAATVITYGPAPSSIQAGLNALTGR